LPNVLLAGLDAPSGVKSRAALAAALNARKVPTARGGIWSHVQVGAILARV